MQDTKISRLPPPSAGDICKAAGRHSEEGLCPECRECWKCGRERPQKCHIDPHALGGANSPENYVLLCRRCHVEAPDVLGDKEAMQSYMECWPAEDMALLDYLTETTEAAWEGGGIPSPEEAKERTGKAFRRVGTHHGRVSLESKKWVVRQIFAGSSGR